MADWSPSSDSDLHRDQDSNQAWDCLGFGKSETVKGYDSTVPSLWKAMIPQWAIMMDWLEKYPKTQDMYR